METLQIKSASEKKKAFSKARKFIHKGNAKSTKVGLCQTIKSKKSRILGPKSEGKTFFFLPKQTNKNN